jgi:hypothetical protein
MGDMSECDLEKCSSTQGRIVQIIRRLHENVISGRYSKLWLGGDRTVLTVRNWDGLALDLGPPVRAAETGLL